MDEVTYQNYGTFLVYHKVFKVAKYKLPARRFYTWGGRTDVLEVRGKDGAGTIHLCLKDVGGRRRGRGPDGFCSEWLDRSNHKALAYPVTDANS